MRKNGSSEERQSDDNSFRACQYCFIKLHFSIFYFKFFDFSVIIKILLFEI
jgi:hypothetical protein